MAIARMLVLWFKMVVLVSMAVFVTSCTSINLVPAYDEQIDSGLTSLYADTITFVDRMNSAHGTPEGSYINNISFYDSVSGRTESLIARAEAHRILSNCPVTNVMNRALKSSKLPENLIERVGAIPSNDCQIVLLKLIKSGFADMRSFHKAQEEKGIPPSARGPLLDGGIGALLRAGIAVEIAKSKK